jgi:hypothetical protein
MLLIAMVLVVTSDLSSGCPFVYKTDEGVKS